MVSDFRKSWFVRLLKFSIISIAVVFLTQCPQVEAAKLNNINRKRSTETRPEKSHRRKTRYHGKREIRTISTEQKTSQEQPVWHRSYVLRRNGKTRNKVIEDAILRLPEFARFLKPLKRRGGIKGLIQRSDYGHMRGTVRRKRLYCRVGIGYHLVITSKGKVRARHKATANGILEIFSVKRSVVGIRSATHKNKYLCMNRMGKIFTRKKFRSDCQFRENLEGNHFNTYASEKYSDHENRRGYFLAISRSGKLPARMKRTSWRQKRAHWLPRHVGKKNRSRRT